MSQYKLDPNDVTVIHIKGSGPGGQNRNKRMSGVRVIHGHTGIVAEATERRSQHQNLVAAFERLEEKKRVSKRKKTRRDSGWDD